MKLRHVVCTILLINAGGLYAMDKPAISTDSLGRTEMHQAAFAGDMYLLSQAILNGWAHGNYKSIVNQIDKQGRAPLHYAVKSGSLECVRTLLQNGANPNVRDCACGVYADKTSVGYTALDFAAMRGDEEIVKELINNNYMEADTLQGAFAHAIHARDCTPVSAKNKRHVSNKLQDAIDACCFTILNSKKLYPEKTQGYECCQRVYKGELSLNEAVRYAQDYPVHQAVIDSDADKCFEYIAGCYSLDEVDTRHMKPLEYAVQNNNCEIATLLLNAGAKSQINDALWVNALWFPSATLPVENIPDILRSKIKMFKLLLDYGADINNYLEVDNRYTLLHRAVIDNRPVAVKFLLECGARTDVRDAQGRTPRDLAIELGHKDVGLLFIKRSKSGANRNRFSSW